MKQVLDFLPLVLFFIFYKIYDIYIATAVLIVASVIQLFVLYALYKKIEKVQMVTFALILIFGSLTIIFHDDSFIKWKVTIVYVLFALALIVGQFMNKSIMKSMLGKELPADDKVWTIVTWWWVVFFIFCALANIYVAFSLSQQVWINFKVFGLTLMTIINTVASVFYIYKSLTEQQLNELNKKSKKEISKKDINDENSLF